MSGLIGGLGSGGKISIIIGAPPAGQIPPRRREPAVLALNEAVADALCEAAVSADCMSDWRCVEVPSTLARMIRNRLYRLQYIGTRPGGDYQLAVRCSPESGGIYFRVSVRRRLGPDGPVEAASQAAMTDDIVYEQEERE